MKKPLGGRERMTSKERVLTTFRHRQADRVPIDYGANPGIHQRLMEYFGLEPGKGPGLGDMLGVDFRMVGAPYKGPTLHQPIEGRAVDPLWGIRRLWVEHGAGGYWDYCDFPLKDADEEMVAKWPGPKASDHDFSGVAEACRKNEKYAVIAATGFGDIINGNGFLRGMEQTFLDLVTNDPAGRLLTDRRMDYQYELTKSVIEAADGGIDIMFLGEDLGTQIGPSISMDIFKSYIRPRYERFTALAKEHGLIVMIHCCGSSSWAFEEFIDMGIHVVDTLQPEAKDMAPAYLKEKFGGRLAFHGCISTAGPVSFGTVDDVVADCRKTLEIMMPGGGYCFAPTHALQDNSPTENVVAMYETVHKYGYY